MGTTNVDGEARTRLTTLVSSLSAAGQKSSELLGYINYPAAVSDLIYLLENEPDPRNQLGFDLRIKIIKSLGELGDARSIVPLVNCYRGYLAFEEMLIEYWKERNLSVPATYQSIVGLIKTLGIEQFSESASQKRFRVVTKGTVIEKLPDTRILDLPAVAWTVRLSIISALGRIKSSEVRSNLKIMLSRERHSDVREEISLQLGKLHDPEAIPGLAELLKEVCTATGYIPNDITEAIDILGNFSETNVEAFDALAWFYKHCKGKEELREHANAVLQQLRERHTAVAEVRQRLTQRQWELDGRCELCGQKVGYLDRMRGIPRCQLHKSSDR